MAKNYIVKELINKMKERIAELKELIRAYREGELKEKER